MAVPPLEFLTGSAKAALPFLRAGVEQGLSATAIIDSLKAEGKTFQRQKMLDAIAVLKGAADPQRFARLIGPNTPLPFEAHTVALVDIRSNYQYLVEAANVETEVSRFVTVSSDVPLSLNNILAKAQTAFLGKGDSAIGKTAFFNSAVRLEGATISGSART